MRYTPGMCCFSGPVQVVRNTRIFARPLAAGRQALVYEMAVEARAEVAMVLPLPVPVGAGEDAVEFVDLSGRPGFFAELDRLFPQWVAAGPPKRGPAVPQPATLKVVEVGSFVASFVPSAADFTRLDPRFRLASGIVDALGVGDWGFAVFQLRGAASWVDWVLGRPAPFHAHPMAFTFPRREPGRVFFPTVHVHDGEVHATAGFDHSLYLQGIEPGEGWERSAAGAEGAPLVAAGERVWRRLLVGELPNADVWVG